jgi:hypothetical protein
MKYLLFLLFLTLTVGGCNAIQTQQVSKNKPQPTSTIINSNNGGEHFGYPRFTTSDNQYLGCWRSVKADEVMNYELKFFHLLEKTIQTSKMSKPIAYREAESNSYKDYFVLHTESKNNDLQSFLSINMVSDDEMTIHEFSSKEDITNGEGVNYWVLKRENCENVFSKFKK